MRFFGVKKATGLSSWGGTKRDGSVSYIWLSENVDYFTGQRQAFILDIYVEEK